MARASFHSRALPMRAFALSVLLAVVAAACQKGPPAGSGFVTPTNNPTTAPADGGIAGSPQPPVYPLGQVQESGANPEFCLPGDTCKGFVVDCPEAGAPAKLILSIGDPIGSNRGVLLFLSGGGGNKLWSQEAKQDLAFSGQGTAGKAIDQAAAKKASDFLMAFRQQGYMTIQASWPAAWLAAPPGQEVGPAKLGCRPATAIKFVHDSYFDRMNVPPSALHCGFCVTGNSGGASQIGYALSFYGLANVIDATVMTGGPPHAALDKACLNVPGYEYNQNLDGVLDASYGYINSLQGPCVRHDASYASIWKKDGIDTGGKYYVYPHSRVLFLLGGQDDTQVGPHQEAYFNKLKSSGSPHVERIVIPDMTHAVTASDEGLKDITNWFEGS
jgi:hypothetical protein